MTRLIVLALSATALAACGGEGPSGPPATGSPGTPEPADTGNAGLSMAGKMEMSLFDRRAPGNEKPSFSLSGRCSLSENGVWAFEDATAVIFSEGAEESRTPHCP